MSLCLSYDKGTACSCILRSYCFVSYTFHRCACVSHLRLHCNFFWIHFKGFRWRYKLHVIKTATIFSFYVSPFALNFKERQFMTSNLHCKTSQSAHMHASGYHILSFNIFLLSDGEKKNLSIVLQLFCLDPWGGVAPFGRHRWWPHDHHLWRDGHCWRDEGEWRERRPLSAQQFLVWA